MNEPPSQTKWTETYKWTVEGVGDLTLTSTAGRWVFSMDGQTGHITLNPDVPQDEAVHAFVSMCNELLSVHRELRLKDEPP